MLSLTTTLSTLEKNLQKGFWVDVQRLPSLHLNRYMCAAKSNHMFIILCIIFVIGDNVWCNPMNLPFKNIPYQSKQCSTSSWGWYNKWTTLLDLQNVLHKWKLCIDIVNVPTFTKCKVSITLAVHHNQVFSTTASNY